MKIKLTLFVSFFLLLSISAFSQTYKENIKKDFKYLNDLIISGQYDEAIDLFPKEIVEATSREQLKAAFTQLLNSKDFKASIMEYEIIEVSQPEKIDSAYYAALRYSSKVQMTFTPPENETQEAKTDRLQRIKLGLSNAFGSDKVQLEESTGTFTMTPIKRSYAISANGKSNWKFVNIEPTQRVIMEKVLPKQLLDRELN